MQNKGYDKLGENKIKMHIGHFIYREALYISNIDYEVVLDIDCIIRKRFNGGDTYFT